MKKGREPKPCARCGRVTRTYEMDWDRTTDHIILVCYHCHGDRDHYNTRGAPKKISKEAMESFLMYAGTPFEKPLKEWL
jgi:hypothetical protein